MRIILTTVLAVALVGLAPLASSDNAPDSPFIQFLDDGIGPVEERLLPVHPTHGGGDHGTSAPDATCEALAPVELTCTTGTRDVGEHLVHSVLVPPCAGSTPAYCRVGTVVSELVGLESGNVRTLRVNYQWVEVGGFVIGLASSDSSGEFPLDEHVEHTCYSYNWASPAMDTLVPGGVGDFGCAISLPTT